MTDALRPSVAIVGVPMRRGSISGGRFDLAPGAILQALDRFVAHPPGTPGRVTELGVTVERPEDMDPVSELTPEEGFEPIRRHVGISLEDELGETRPDRAVILLGGDNSITRPGVHAAAPTLDRVGLLTIDAHHDLRETEGGLSNGNPVRALLEDGLPGGNVVQVGIQPLANSPAHSEVAREAGVTVVTADDVRARGIDTVVAEALDRLSGAAETVYVDLDLDVLDRAFAPACPGARPGGLLPADVQRAARLCGEHPKVRAIDLVEVDPERDVADVTVLTAASCVLWFAAGVARRGATSR